MRDYPKMMYRLPDGAAKVADEDDLNQRLGNGTIETVIVSDAEDEAAKADDGFINEPSDLVAKGRAKKAAKADDGTGEQ
ncbi:MAG: hypothetical protein ACM3VY_00245 [Candidatus Bathyarchaeota archaeon]